MTDNFQFTYVYYKWGLTTGWVSFQSIGQRVPGILEMSHRIASSSALTRQHHTPIWKEKTACNNHKDLSTFQSLKGIVKVINHTLRCQHSFVFYSSFIWKSNISRTHKRERGGKSGNQTIFKLVLKSESHYF